jgi:hypothetical protein
MRPVVIPAFLLVLLVGANLVSAQERVRVAIIVRDGSSYASPHLPQTPTKKVVVDSVFKVHDEKTDAQGRLWVQISDGAEKLWVPKSLCVVRNFQDWELVQPFVKLVRSQSWSAFDKQRVLKGVVDLAMTPDQVLLSWGKPLKILKPERVDGKEPDPFEEWSYGPMSLIFRGGVVAQIITKPTEKRP